MERHVEQGHAPGLVSVVSRRGDAHIEVIGDAAVDGAPLDRDAIFRISSMTKPITAVATLMLVEDCVVRLDEPVERLLPELADRRVLRRIDGPVDDTVPANRSITVRDLLTFTFGFGGYFEPCPISDFAAPLELSVGPPQPQLPPGPDEWMRRFSTLPLMVQPGERWLYHTGSDLLGVLIARAAGQSFEAFLRERIFEPLGMRDTALFGFHRRHRSARHELLHRSPHWRSARVRSTRRAVEYAARVPVGRRRIGFDRRRLFGVRRDAVTGRPATVVPPHCRDDDQ